MVRAAVPLASLTALAGGLCVVACGQPDAGNAEAGSAGDDATAADAGVHDAGPLRVGLAYDEMRQVGGITRKAHLYFPPRTEGEVRPLVILLHGNGGSADETLGRSG